MLKLYQGHIVGWQKVFWGGRGGGSSVGRASACLFSHCEWQHDRSHFKAPPMPAHRYIEENSLVPVLATKRSAGVTPEVTLRECVTCMPLPSMNKATHSGFETQRKYHQKSEKRVLEAPKKTYVFWWWRGKIFWGVVTKNLWMKGW